MNSLSVQAVHGVAAMNANSSFVARFSMLDPRTQREVVERAVEWGVERGINDWREANRYRAMNGLGALGQDALTNAVALAVQKALTPLMPVLGEKLMAVAEPAARKAAEVVGPVLDERLRTYGPKFAIISGLVAAILGIIGMVLVGGYVVKKVA
jgi:hypothetical protein